MERQGGEFILGRGGGGEIQEQSSLIGKAKEVNSETSTSSVGLVQTVGILPSIYILVLTLAPTGQVQRYYKPR